MCPNPHVFLDADGKRLNYGNLRIKEYEKSFPKNLNKP